MRVLLCFLLISLMNCKSQFIKENAVKSQEVSFEDRYHYPFSLIKKDYLVIKNQTIMDSVFTKIHQNTQRNRFSPIPTVNDFETYIIIKPQLKNTNDVLVDKIFLHKDTLIIETKEFYNPDFNEASRITPNILLKLTSKPVIKKITIQY